MPREKVQAAPTARPKVLMRRKRADCSVVVTKRLQWLWSEGGGSLTMNRANWQREEPEAQRKAAAFDGTSQMMREYQVRICERLKVKFPGPTRQSRLTDPSKQHPYSITSSALASRAGGTVRPSAFAVLRLMMN
jgi:hypothetical protein